MVYCDINSGMPALSTISVFVFLLYVNPSHLASSNGQKAHFQVEDKSGDLKVIATKDMAKVTSQADSVQVVVKPGMADYPVVKSDKPIVHVANRCCGWNTIAFKKSLISKGNKTHKAKSIHLGNKLKNNDHFEKVQARNPTFKKSSTTVKKSKTIASLFKKAIVLKQKSKDEEASKKSSLQSGDVGFAVTGTAGKLNMDVTKVGTKVSSESGLLNVFLKRKANPSIGVAKDSVNVHHHEIVHIAPELISGDGLGLRKSNVPSNNKVNDKRLANNN